MDWDDRIAAYQAAICVALEAGDQERAVYLARALDALEASKAGPLHPKNDGEIQGRESP